METQKLVVVLLIVAIIFSAANILISSGFDFGDYAAVDCADRVNCVGSSGSDNANIGVSVIAPPEENSS
ncbi:MAG: hypothetical protein KJ600_01965 [Nanoarchaeota archaeon]|nr:hypothetical protein [Nanoarchaeota archaeon]MBU1103302.1 hypothetical protein [Nanoarchaeota archaeon]